MKWCEEHNIKAISSKKRDCKNEQGKEFKDIKNKKSTIIALKIPYF